MVKFIDIFLKKGLKLQVSAMIWRENEGITAAISHRDAPRNRRAIAV